MTTRRIYDINIPRKFTHVSEIFEIWLNERIFRSLLVVNESYI